MANLTIEQLTSFTGTPQNSDLIIIHDGNNAKKITYAELLTKIFSGSTSLQADGSQFNLTGHIIPTTNDVYDLGNPEYKFRDLYLGREQKPREEPSLFSQPMKESIRFSNWRDSPKSGPFVTTRKKLSINWAVLQNKREETSPHFWYSLL